MVVGYSVATPTSELWPPIAPGAPIAALLMIWAGITTPEALAAKRPHIIVGCFVFGMLLTPPDVVSQTGGELLTRPW